MDTAQDLSPAVEQDVPSRHRVSIAGVAAWLLLLAAIAWWVLDDSGSGWPVIGCIVAGFFVLYQVNEAWVARDLAADRH